MTVPDAAMQRAKAPACLRATRRIVGQTADAWSRAC